MQETPSQHSSKLIKFTLATRKATILLDEVGKASTPLDGEKSCISRPEMGHRLYRGAGEARRGTSEHGRDAGLESASRRVEADV